MAVSRSLGDHFAKEMNLGLIGEPYVSPAIEVSSDAVIVLASDGVSEREYRESNWVVVGYCIGKERRGDCIE